MKILDLLMDISSAFIPNWNSFSRYQIVFSIILLILRAALSRKKIPKFR